MTHFPSQLIAQHPPPHELSRKWLHLDLKLDLIFILHMEPVMYVFYTFSETKGMAHGHMEDDR